MRVTAPYSVEAHFQTLDSRTRRAAPGLRRFFGVTRQQGHFFTSSPPVPAQGRIFPVHTKPASMDDGGQTPPPFLSIFCFLRA